MQSTAEMSVPDRGLRLEIKKEEVYEMARSKKKEYLLEFYADSYDETNSYAQRGWVIAFSPSVYLFKATDDVDAISKVEGHIGAFSYYAREGFRLTSATLVLDDSSFEIIKTWNRRQILKALRS